MSVTGVTVTLVFLLGPCLWSQLDAITFNFTNSYENGDVKEKLLNGVSLLCCSLPHMY